MKTPLPRLTLECAPYHGTIFDPKKLQRSVEISAQHISQLRAEMGVQIHAVAGTGISGLPIASALAARLGLYPMFILSPETGETRRIGRQYMGPTGVFNFVLCDDMISSGHTVHQMLEVIQDAAPKAKCIAISLHRSGQIEPDLTISTYQFHVGDNHITWNERQIPILKPLRNRHSLYYPPRKENIRNPYCVTE